MFRSKDPELTRYETAVGGLFLTGAATFPGAGVWGASGRNCAGVVLDTHASVDRRLTRAECHTSSANGCTGSEETRCRNVPRTRRKHINGSISLGRFAGIRVNVHWSAALIAIADRQQPARTWSVSTPAVVGTVGFLVSILLHEFGHALTARRFGVGTESIQLWALGGVARLSREPRQPKAEGWIAAAGPLTSVAIAVASLGAWWALGGHSSNSDFVSVLAWLGFINAALAVFNLLPGAPLDGGRILKAAALGDPRQPLPRRCARPARAGSVLGWMLAGRRAGADAAWRIGVRG